MKYEDKLYDSEDIGFPKDQEVLTVDPDLCSGILTIKNSIPFFNGDRLVFFTGSGSDDRTSLGLFFCRIRDDDPAGRLFFGRRGFDNDPVV